MKKVEVHINIQTEAERVIKAFVDEEMLKEWWGVERSHIDKKVDGSYILAWQITEEGIKYVSTGMIKTYDPSGELHITNLTYLNPEKTFLGPMSLLVSASQKEDHSEVYLCQDGYQVGGDWEWYYEAVKEAWPSVMVTLKEYLEELGRNS